MLQQMISNAFFYLDEMRSNSVEMKERALQSYRDALRLPRKKKKRAKKVAEMEYNIACWLDDFLDF